MWRMEVTISYENIYVVKISSTVTEGMIGTFITLENIPHSVF